MGVPSRDRALGATPAQIVEAQRLASAHRGGDRSGVGLPSGFIMELKGITGSVPDPLPFINYLDQQMSRAALAGVVDLGNTSNGSRALGDTFVDLLMLSAAGRRGRRRGRVDRRRRRRPDPPQLTATGARPRHHRRGRRESTR